MELIFDMLAMQHGVSVRHYYYYYYFHFFIFYYFCWGGGGGGGGCIRAYKLPSVIQALLLIHYVYMLKLLK